ncbi:hypothetical protein AX17_002295 [Amanita inopinata Kibby_2008]|nr:hypothetical protein AX17_002295 [Amanita inopinata Kibby_2008]
MLESLCEISGLQSFLLAVDPTDPADGGFLGGSVAGREFWRTVRGGGETGAKAFRQYCLDEVTPHQPHIKSVISAEDIPQLASAAGTKKTTAKSLKSELYDKFRKALRKASGIRTAEMKWTNPERLDVYGVRLIGWPNDVPAQNPSTLKQSQNKQLMQALDSGTLKFERVVGRTEGSSKDHTPTDSNAPEEAVSFEEDFSWAYDADAGNRWSPPAAASMSQDPTSNQARFESDFSPREEPSGHYGGVGGYLDPLVMTCGTNVSDLYLGEDDMQPPPVKRARTEEFGGEERLE